MKNKDVYDKLIEIRDTQCAKAHNPAGCKEFVNNQYIPPVSACEWRKID